MTCDVKTCVLLLISFLFFLMLYRFRNFPEWVGKAPESEEYCLPEFVEVKIW